MTAVPFAPGSQVDSAEETRAQRAVARMSKAPKAVGELTRQVGRGGASDGVVGKNVRDTLEPYTGPLPLDLRLRIGSYVDNVLAGRHARALATGHEIWMGGPHLLSSPVKFAGVFAHEAAHVASGGSAAANPPHFDFDDPLPSSWYEAEQAQRAELEAAETGEGRQRTLDRLATMADSEVRREAPGIAYRAQDRGDIELASVAAQRLLDVWLANSDYPVTLTALGPPDAVDVLLGRAESAFGASHWALGGKYLAVAMVQLVRIAHITVLRRPPQTDEPGAELARAILLPWQRGEENDIRRRLEHVRTLLQSQGAAVLARGEQDEIAQFEAMAESVHAAERRAGPRIVEDLGTGGVIEEPATGGRRGGRRAATETEVETPPARPETPASRADEAIVDSSHPDLERALVFYSTSPPTSYCNIESPRYGVAGTFVGARRLAGELFGRRSTVIVEDLLARDPQGARQIRYLVFALTVRLNPPSTRPPEGQFVHVGNVEMLTRPASSRYLFIALTSGDWVFFRPQLEEYVESIQASEANVEPRALSAEDRRAAVFGPIDALIAAGETQEAANQLTYVGAQGFALVDTDAKIRYLVTMLQAFTFQANEETVVEVFGAVADAQELRTILAGLQREGVLRQLRTDLETAFPSLLMVLGQKFGAESLSSAQVERLLGELRIFTPIPGIEIRADGSFALNLDLVSEFVAAIEGLIATISSAVTGIIDIILDPAAFLEGIYKLIYFAVMADLATKGNLEAIRYVAQVVGGIARQLGIMTRGIVILQENMPEGVEFVRDMQRSIEWRIVWEVIGLFVGVGEAVALIDAVRGGRAAAAISDLAAGLSRAGRAGRVAGATEEATGAARLLEGGADVARVGEEAVEGTSRTGRATSEVEESAQAARRTAEAAEGVAPAERTLERSVHDAAERTGAEVQLADGTHGVAVAGAGPMRGLYFCSDNCALLADKLDALLQALPENYPGKEVFAGLQRRAAAADEALRAGRITAEQADAIAAELAGELNRLAPHFPGVGPLLNMAPEALRAEAAVIRREYERGLELSEDIENIEGPIGEVSGPRRPRPSVSSMTSLERAADAGIPAELIGDGTVLTRADFPDVLPEAPPRTGRVAPERLEPITGLDNAGRPVEMRPVSRSDIQNADVLHDYDLLVSAGADPAAIRINQMQIIEDMRVGINRPDLYAEINGHRVLIEYDRAPGTRAIDHARRILSNDPDAIVILKIVDFD